MSIACVILASGHSRRFGSENKLLANFQDKPLISHILTNLPKELFDKVVVVVRDDAVEAIVKNLGYSTIKHNLEYKSDSLKVGLKEVLKFNLCMLCVADQPMCSRETFENMIRTGVDNPQKITRLYWGSTPSNPTVFPKKYYNTLLMLEKDMGGAKIAKKYPEEVLKVNAKSEKEICDIDTLKDLEDLLK